MPKDDKTKAQLKKHKIYRWIALFFKLILGPVFSLAFQGIVIQITLPYIGTQTLGTFLATTFTLIIYYGIIFVLDRVRNFKTHTDLKKCIAVYTLVVLVLMGIESTFSGTIQNLLYKVTNLGYRDSYISIATVNNRLVYILLGFAVQLSFSFATGRIIFYLYKKVLIKPDVLAKI